MDDAGANVSTIPSKADVDKALQEKRQRRDQRACYPCSSRKVRCDRTTPCRTCVQRGHPEICIPSGHFRETATSRETVRPRRKRSARPTSTATISPVLQLAHQDPAGNPAEIGVTTDVSASVIAPTDDIAQPTFVGQDSLPSFIETTPRADGTPSDNMRQTLGLQNTWEMYPYMRQTGTPNLAKEVNLLIPSHGDVLKYSQCYQTIVWPFYPHVASSEQLDSLICTYLERSSIRETSGSPIFSDSISQCDLARASLLLAILASGVHFSDQPPQERKMLSQEYARRAFHCARLSNFLLRPTLDSVQALLVLGHVLQNNSQADASWALLGTTIRLAQSLGLHSDQTAKNLPVEIKTNRKNIWQSLLWQDSLLSLSFDRPPAKYSPDTEAEPTPESDLSYIQCMYAWSAIGRELLERSRSERASVDTMQLYLEKLDEINSRSQSHLRTISACASRQARMEHHAFHLQQAFCSSFVCRPAMLSTNTPGREEEVSFILIRARDALLETIRAFMALQSLTILPLRSWSMIHAAISAALLLQLQDEVSHSDEARILQNSLINALSRESGSESESSSSQTQPWLSVSHLRALRTLKGSLAKRPSVNETRYHATTDLSQHDEIPERPPTNLLSEAEMADLSMDNFGNIDWGWKLYGGDLGDADSLMQQFLGF